MMMIMVIMVMMMVVVVMMMMMHGDDNGYGDVDNCWLGTTLSIFSMIVNYIMEANYNLIFDMACTNSAHAALRD